MNLHHTFVWTRHAKREDFNTKGFHFTWMRRPSTRRSCDGQE
jgi:hypothetical protein